MKKKIYLHVSYIAGPGDGTGTYRSCVLTLTKGDYNHLFEVLKKDYCERTGAKLDDIKLSILSLNEISKRTFKILNGE